MTAKRMRENQLGDKNRLQGATNYIYSLKPRLLFICERYFDQKWSKKEENHLNDFRVRSGGKCKYRSLGMLSSSILRLCSPPPSS